MSLLARLTSIFLLLPTVALANADAGAIGKIRGSGVLERNNEVIDGDTGVGVMSMDTAVTARGQMQIDFIDDTRVDITEHSRLLIDEFVYDPANGKAALGLRATIGTVRYASGQIAKNFKQNVKIRTPSATIGVRGTDFVMVVDEVGGSMITLLPSCDEEGMCYTGEIQVETDAGFVIMNQAFQTTITSISSQAPSKPLVLDLDEKMISQLLILRKKRPYDEEEDQIRLEKRKMFDFLGLDFLEFDALDADALTDSIEGIWKTQLDETDYMLADVLYDMLDQLNAALMEIFKDELLKQNQAFFTVKKEGLDLKSGIFYELQDDTHLVRRMDNAGDNFFQLRLSTLYGYVLDLQQQDWTFYEYNVGVGNNNSITITQRTY
tara:strand:- start:97 stop:1233 length:1137 start_codon:yes stop_codon:yes gene_type:complete